MYGCIEESVLLLQWPRLAFENENFEWIQRKTSFRKNVFEGPFGLGSFPGPFLAACVIESLSRVAIVWHVIVIHL